MLQGSASASGLRADCSASFMECESRGDERRAARKALSRERVRERDACQGGRCEGHYSVRGRLKRERLARTDRRMSDTLSFTLDLGHFFVGGAEKFAGEV